MQLSVALGTYNGAEFLEEQLDSIARQHRQPDELVIIDDCSTDASLQIIKHFAGQAAFPVNLRVNPRNLGVRKNFELAIRCCTGNIIALADQDDVWQPKKLQRLEEVFQAETGVGAVASDSLLVDANLKPTGYTFWQSLGFSPQKQYPAPDSWLFRVLLRDNVISGNSLAFRSSLRTVILPIPEVWAHDAWVAVLAAALLEMRLLPEPLLCYRQHGGNQIGAPQDGVSKWQHFHHKDDPSAYFLNDMERCLLLAERLLEVDTVRPFSYVMEQLLEKMEHLKIRLGVRIEKRRLLTAVFKDFFCRRYHSYSGGWSSFLRDLIF